MLVSVALSASSARHLFSYSLLTDVAFSYGVGH